MNEAHGNDVEAKKPHRSAYAVGFRSDELQGQAKQMSVIELQAVAPE